MKRRVFSVFCACVLLSAPLVASQGGPKPKPPKPTQGTDLMKAAYGFKNLGQFVAAVNVSNNHEGISFFDLKKLMVKEGYSLGQAMQKLKATDATTEARRAEYEANRMIQTTEKDPQ